MLVERDRINLLTSVSSPLTTIDVRWKRRRQDSCFLIRMSLYPGFHLLVGHGTSWQYQVIVVVAVQIWLVTKWISPPACEHWFHASQQQDKRQTRVPRPTIAEEKPRWLCRFYSRALNIWSAPLFPAAGADFTLAKLGECIFPNRRG